MSYAGVALQYSSLIPGTAEMGPGQSVIIYIVRTRYTCLYTPVMRVARAAPFHLYSLSPVAIPPVSERPASLLFYTWAAGTGKQLPVPLKRGMISGVRDYRKNYAQTRRAVQRCGYRCRDRSASSRVVSGRVIILQQ